MLENVNNIRKELEEDLKNTKNIVELSNLKVKYLGKKGLVTSLTANMKDLSIEEKKEVGRLSNELKKYVTDTLQELETNLKKAELDERLKSEKIDISLPSTKVPVGGNNILEKLTFELEELFMSMGYDVASGPEVEKDLYNFELLNLPKGHPARDAQDTFYTFGDTILLRSQTSPVQIRTMLANEEKTPIRMICAGKTYRREDDATHSHQFGQVEGLVIDKKERNVSLADLKGTLEIFVKKLIGKNCELRFRPSYFPFTEPSYEVDVSCFKCGGKGCSLCKQTGWIEVLGSGIVHPNVLKMNGYDPEQYSGFAFGTGLERLAMFKYGIPDMRYLYANDIRFLSQFDRKDEE